MRRKLRNISRMLSTSQTPSNRHNFLISRSSKPRAVLIWARRTKPSGPGTTDSTTPLGQQLRFVFSSLMSTNSPGFRLGYEPCHLLLGCTRCNYSLSHLSQNKSARYCALRQERRQPSAFKNTPGGAPSAIHPVSNMLGVRAARSSGLDGRRVIGRSFKMRSTSVNKVKRSNSFNVHSPIKDRKIFRTLRKKRSVTPFWCDAIEG